MENWQGQPRAFNVYLYLMLSIVLLLGASFIVLVYEQLQYQAAVKNREQSIQLAAELRQSSNDLARLVRTYIITGNPLYKEQFQAVVAIRDGKRPRPKNYSLAYWDLHALDQTLMSVEMGETISLLDLMRRTGITEKELANLQRSKAKSDVLVALENDAIRLVEEDTPVDPNKRDQALNMLADDYFMAMKVDIMQPIVETERMIILRTQAAVDKAQTRLTLVISSLFVLGLLLVFLITKLGKQLRLIIGCSVKELEAIISELGKGHFLTPIQVSEGDAESVVGWLAKTQRNLASLNLAHFKAIVASSEDAIISKDIHGTVASWNSAAERIFGYTADEMIGKPLARIIPPERAQEEPDILEKVAKGEKVEHFVTQRVHKNGHLVDISVCISPIFNQQGQVIGASKIARDISATLAAEAEIRRLAFFDPLTGLANRRLFIDRLNQLFLMASREHFALALLYIDLDNFKSLNDTQGHAAGDELLKDVANRIQECVRKSDTVARLGGDEFVVLLADYNEPSASPAWAITIAEKIGQLLNQPYATPLGVHRCTSSIGIAVFNGQAVKPDDILRTADRAMYMAKSKGKNGYVVLEM